MRPEYNPEARVYWIKRITSGEALEDKEDFISDPILRGLIREICADLKRLGGYAYLSQRDNVEAVARLIENIDDQTPTQPNLPAVTKKTIT